MILMTAGNYHTCGTKATKIGGELLRGMYLHMATVSCVRHFLRRAANNLVLPLTV